MYHMFEIKNTGSSLVVLLRTVTFILHLTSSRFEVGTLITDKHLLALKAVC